MFRFPCLGRWKFLRLTNENDPRYRQVLFRLTVPQSRDAFLDLGCCLGQAIRQLRRDGVRGARLFGVDLQSQFINIGFDLFQDKDSLDAQFLVGDIVDPDDRRLDAMAGKVTIIHAGSFFHLFSWTQQLYIGKRIVGFLKEGTQNALIYGRHVGTIKPGATLMGNHNAYLHDRQSFQKLWNEVGELTGTSWAVDLESDGDSFENLPPTDKDLRRVNFTVHQIP